ncbi:YhcN/YlaJ family sporulation lipoprotein [Bacillus sp. A116_S68]|nr:YhcN/YlaJ family sporulation lipoprotein [Bacillus sp. A116_S68]
MKKVALCLSVITLMFTGVTGCGDVDNANVEGQNYGLQGRNQTGLQQGFTHDGTGMGAAHHQGQGGMSPRGAGTGQGRVITDTGAGYGGAFRGTGAAYDGRGGLMQGDAHFGGQQGMMTRDERYGTGAQARDGRARGFQAGQNRRGGFSRGITGNDRRGMVDDNGLLNGTMRGFNRTDNHVNRGTRDQMHGGTAIERNQPRGQQRGFGQGKEKGQQQAYYDSDDGRLASRIENRVEGLDEVRDCDVVVNDNNVVIGVEPEGNDGEQVEDRVRSFVEDMDDNKQVHVVTERNGAEKIHDMENRLRDGEPFEEVGATFNAMLDDLGDAIQRPFERTR